MAEKPRQKKTVEQLREELLSDPDTKRIAKAVGMELGPYVDLVLDYATNPGKEPVLQVASDEELRAAGYNPPSAQEVANFFIDGANGKLELEGPDFNKSGFESAAAGGGKPSLQGDAGQKPVAKDDQKNQELLSGVNTKGGSGRM